MIYGKLEAGDLVGAIANDDAICEMDVSEYGKDH
jgi:hypothetical protein